MSLRDFGAYQPPAPAPVPRRAAWGRCGQHRPDFGPFAALADFPVAGDAASPFADVAGEYATAPDALEGGECALTDPATDPWRPGTLGCSTNNNCNANVRFIENFRLESPKAWYEAGEELLVDYADGYSYEGFAWPMSDAVESRYGAEPFADVASEDATAPRVVEGTVVEGSVGEGRVFGPELPAARCAERTAFLAAVGLERYDSLLSSNEVDMEALRLADEDDLRDVGVKKGPRIKILRALHARSVAIV